MIKSPQLFRQAAHQVATYSKKLCKALALAVIEHCASYVRLTLPGVIYIYKQLNTDQIGQIN